MAGDADGGLVTAQLTDPPPEIGVQARSRVEWFRSSGHLSSPTQKRIEYLRRKSCSLLKQDHMRLSHACQAGQHPALPNRHQEGALMVDPGSTGGAVGVDGEL